MVTGRQASDPFRVNRPDADALLAARSASVLHKASRKPYIRSCPNRPLPWRMMDFFVPAADSPDEAEKVWQATRQFAKDNLGWEVGDRRIFRLSGIHAGERIVCEVGKAEPYGGEVVVAILESNAFLVCTANRGVLRGEPILVGTSEVDSVIDFDAPKPAS